MKLFLVKGEVLGYDETDTIQSELINLLPKEAIEVDSAPPTPDHVWKGEWVLPKTLSTKQAWQRVRYSRVTLLEEVDILVNIALDSGDPDKLKKATKYRQELRDITKQTDPTNIIWPNKPEI